MSCASGEASSAWPKRSSRASKADCVRCAAVAAAPASPAKTTSATAAGQASAPLIMSTSPRKPKIAAATAQTPANQPRRRTQSCAPARGRVATRPSPTLRSNPSTVISLDPALPCILFTTFRPLSGGGLFRLQPAFETEDIADDFGHRLVLLGRDFLVDLHRGIKRPRNRRILDDRHVVLRGDLADLG